MSEEPGAPPQTVEGTPLYGVDSMVFVYHFEGNQEFGPAAGRLLQAAEEGRCRLVCSIISLLEVLVVPKRRGREDLCQVYREMFESFPHLSVVPVHAGIAEVASDLRATQNLRTPDAIHLATALHAGADAFVSQDDRLRNLPIQDLRVLPLDQVFR